MKRKYFKFGCSCTACKAGRRRGHKSNRVKVGVRAIARAARHRWNRLAAEGRDDEIGIVSMGYTD